MQRILEAIRNRLISDTGITSIVGESDISCGYVKEETHYPCITIEAKSISSVKGVSGTMSGIIGVDIYSDNSKEELWSIYSMSKSLLHNTEQELSLHSCSIHLIREIKVTDAQYDSSGTAWQLTSIYEVIYSVTDISLTTSVSGIVYGGRDLVEAEASMEIGEFRGAMSLDVRFEGEFHSGRERFSNSVYHPKGYARVLFQEMYFHVSVLELLWKIDMDSNGSLRDGITPAITYNVNQNTHPAYVKVLFQMLRTDNGKRMEVEAPRAICQQLQIPFNKDDFIIYDCEWILLSDVSGEVVKVSVED
ncbi:hypothetical protein GF312_02095 [Candidatus Poribacteria bacterium]|nr:hypothetical protein [Candidatus Poribacteria bacterium]